MKFSCTVRMDNAAFAAGEREEEVGRILDGLSDAFRNRGQRLGKDCSGSLFDINGNRVGEWKVAT